LQKHEQGIRFHSSQGGNMKQASSKSSNSRCIKRRAFIKAGSAAVATAAITPAVASETQPMVVVAHGTDLAKMVEA
jgi:hypothetical protein